jgi:hypothetical protein
MRTGQNFTKSPADPHLRDGVIYTSVFPRGNPFEVALLAKIPASKKSYTTTVFNGQSAILVESDTWAAICAKHGII